MKSLANRFKIVALITIIDIFLIVGVRFLIPIRFLEFDFSHIVVLFFASYISILIVLAYDRKHNRILFNDN